jgi:pimeloyl-ACP methyl ester carboxylesterase
VVDSSTRVMQLTARRVRTRRGAEVRVLEAGDAGAPPLVFLHGIMGLLDDTRCLETLAKGHHVFAPELPGYGVSNGEELLEDMLDFALHGWDVLESLSLHGPVLVGHSLGGMIAAEMACLAPADIPTLILVDPFGVWLDEQPIPDLFAMLPFEFGDYLFHDPARAEQLLPGVSDLAEPEALRQFTIDTARQLGTAGKLLFPIPNRRLSKRLYRLTTPTLVVWGEDDRLMPAAHYAARWQSLVPHAQLATLPGAGHMLPYEQPDALAEAISRFAGREAPAG